jgi:hypothetical protein
MIQSLLSRRLARQLPILRLLAVVQLALLARRHLRGLTRSDRGRLFELIRRGPVLSGPERGELRALAAKLRPGAFAVAAADHFSPVALPKRFRPQT